MGLHEKRLLLWWSLIVAIFGEELPQVGVKYAPMVSLEHVNLNSGVRWSEELEEFWFKVLGCARDPRAEGVLNVTNTARRGLGSPALGGLMWANIGLQQFHLPFADELETEFPSQTIRGEIVLTWPRDKLAAVRERLAAWELHDDDRFVGPFGNRFVLEAGDEKFGPGTLPGGESEGLGLRALRFDVPEGSTAGICEFYRRIFGAIVEFSEERCAVRIGSGQALEFFSRVDRVPAYDFHHVAIYINGPEWRRAYDRLSARDLVFNNPRFPQFRYDTLDLALEFNEFRFKDIVDLDGGRVLYELEHEVRNLRHPGFILSHHHPHVHNTATGPTPEL